MNHTRIAAVVALATAGLLLVGCSNSTPKADGRPATANPSAGAPVGYLYDVDKHAHPRADDQTLVDQLETRCTDNTLVLEFAATNTSVDLVNTPKRPDVHTVLRDLADHLPTSGKTNCQPRLTDTKARLGGK
ncbi:hypothetical protein [Streptomyces sp. NPDC001828]|uniref:hypothetical protein n=1 Tax=Streptomyces sp. NPDC001828 TaxID=3364615 RepID=UPI0036ADBA42